MRLPSHDQLQAYASEPPARAASAFPGKDPTTLAREAPPSAYRFPRRRKSLGERFRRHVGRHPIYKVFFFVGLAAAVIGGSVGLASRLSTAELPSITRH